MASLFDNCNRADNGASPGTPSDGLAAWEFYGVDGNLAIYHDGAYLSGSPFIYVNGATNDSNQRIGVRDNGNPDAAVRLTVGNYAAYSLLVLRAHTDGSCVAAILSGGAAIIYTSDGSSFTQISTSASVTLTAGDVWEFSVTDDAYTLKQNDITRLTVSSSHNALRTKHGFGILGNGAFFVDDVYQDDLGPPAFATYTLATQTGITTDGTADVGPAGGYDDALLGWNYEARFRSTSGLTGLAVRLSGYAANLKLHLYQDGTHIAGPITVPNVGGTTLVTLAALGTLSGVHEYKILYSGVHYAYELVTYGGAIDTSAITDRELWTCHGDSITFSVFDPDFDAVYGYPHLLSLSQGVAVRNNGISATHCWDNDNAAGYATAGMTDARVNTIPTQSARVIVLYGANDAQNLQYAETDAQFGAAYGTMVSRIRTRIGAGKPIHCIQILPVFTGLAQTNRTDFNAALSGALTTLADADVRDIPSDGWIVAGDTVDNLHPNSGTGYPKVHDAYLAAVGPAFEVTAGDPLERGQAGQTLTLTFTRGDVTDANQFTLESGTVTGLSGSGPYTLTVTAPTASGDYDLSFADDTGTATVTVSVEDTTVPSSPSGVSAGSPTVFSVPVSFTLPAASPAGETITGRAYKNAVSVATGLTSSPYTFTGVVDGDVLGITSYDGVNESSAAEVTFSAPSGGSTSGASRGRIVNAGGV